MSTTDASPTDGPTRLAEIEDNLTCEGIVEGESVQDLLTLAREQAERIAALEQHIADLQATLKDRREGPAW